MGEYSKGKATRSVHFRYTNWGAKERQQAPKKMMKIDGHPFAMNMVDVARDEGSSQAKILTSSSAKKSGAVDPRAHIAADEVKGKGLQEDAGHSSVPRRCVTSQMLLNKFQRDRERRQRREKRSDAGKIIGGVLFCLLLERRVDIAIGI